MDFVALDHYLQIFSDGTFWTSLLNNSLYALYTIVIGNIVALLLALLLESDVSTGNVKGREVYRFLLFSQFILSWVVVGFLWKRLLNPYDGMLNIALRTIGLSALTRNWLGDPSTAMLSIAAASVWKGFGFGLVVYSASIRNIPGQIMEAAKIDGANRLQIASLITLPLIRPFIGIVVMLNLIDAFRVIDPFLVMATAVPPKSAQVIGTYIYKTGFDYYKLGYSAALSIVMLLIVVVISSVYFKLQNRHGR